MIDLAANRRAAKRTRVDLAVDWLVHRIEGSYVEAAAQFGVTANSVRSRVEYVHGSLAQARSSIGIGRVSTSRKRKCLVCRKEVELEKNLYICKPCRDEVSNAHDGAV